MKDSKLETFKMEFWSANAFQVEVGTNTPQGGNDSHGGQTLFRLKDATAGGTCWSITVRGQNGDVTTFNDFDEFTLTRWRL